MTESNNFVILIQVINLLRRPDRLKTISSDLKKAGLTFETLIAVDGLAENFESEFLSKGEIGCFKSHINAMRRQVEVGAQYSFILEDDAKLSPEVDQSYLLKLTDLMERNRLDMLQVGFTKWLYLPSLRAGILEFLIAILKGRGTRDSSGIRFVLGEFRAGTHAYLVNNRIAEAFSLSNAEPSILPWDDWLGLIAMGQAHRKVRIARLVNSSVSQESRISKSSVVDSDV